MVIDVKLFLSRLAELHAALKVRLGTTFSLVFHFTTTESDG